MEKVWEELKKIETKAEQIQSDAQKSAKQLTTLAQQQAEKLLADSKRYAQEEAQQLLARIMKEANLYRDQHLEANKANIETLDAQAEQLMEKASSAIVKAVLGESQA